MNDIKIFENNELGFKVRTLLNPDGSISVNAEDTAIGYGWTQTQVKNGKQYTSIRWETLNGYCTDLGFPNKLGKDDYLPESLFYMLGFKAGNDRALKYQQWLAMEVLPSLRRTGSYKMPKRKEKVDTQDRTRIMEMNARSRMAQTYLKLAQVDRLSGTYKTILTAKAAETLAGEPILPLPKSERKAYSAGEIGEMLGVTANKVGRIANEYHLKTEKYGEYRRSKSEHSVKEVDTWVYFESVIPEFEKILRHRKGECI